MTSRFVDILNRIRQNANPNWFTPSQQAAYNILSERLGFLDEVNLWGNLGVGKTFIGWILHKQRLAVYAPRLEEIVQKQGSAVHQIAVIDNMGWRRHEVRDALHLCRSQGCEKLLLITTEPVEEQMAVVELQLTEEDLAKASTNLRSIRVLPNSDAVISLWNLVSPVELSRKGEV